jgi:hypothetical protein
VIPTVPFAAGTDVGSAQVSLVVGVVVPVILLFLLLVGYFCWQGRRKRSSSDMVVKHLAESHDQTSKPESEQHVIDDIESLASENKLQ